MASKVSIINSALIRLGANMITSLTEDSEEARLANSIFNESLDYLLQLYPWSFALEETDLAESAAPPIYSYTFAYQLPVLPYCLQVVEVQYNIPYEIKGRFLYTNWNDVNITYIKRIADMNDLSAAFVQAFSFYLASQLAVPLTHDRGVADSMENKFQLSFQKAKTRDTQQNKYKLSANGSWLNVRRS
jgi:hypothetical protein